MLAGAAAAPALAVAAIGYAASASRSGIGVTLSPSPAPSRSVGGMYELSFSATTRGLSPAWTARMPSSVSVRSSTSSADSAFRRSATGR